MHPIRLCSVAAALLGALAVSTLPAQSVFATQVLGSNTNGGAGGGIFAPQNALGAPLGAFDVHSLGIGGDLTLGFALPIANGPGADFLVAENAFFVGGTFFGTFAELMFVEVSSDGVSFVRFPSRWFGPGSAPGAFGSLVVGSSSNLAGQHVALGPLLPGDPQDVCEAGGDAFDLADLAAHPLVLTGALDLMAITHVRLVDVVGGQSLDSRLAPIFDAGTGSADVDAVTVIHQQGLVDPNGPNVAITIAVDGTIVVRLEDPDGWQDLDYTTLRSALFGLPFDVGGMISTFFQVQSADATGFTLVQPFPLPSDLLFSISFSVKDLQGHRSGAQKARPTS